jgi:uncharacterized membrane protein YkvA (DUF1232 family)
MIVRGGGDHKVGGDLRGLARSVSGGMSACILAIPIDGLGTRGCRAVQWADHRSMDAMTLEAVETMITDALADEAKTGRLANALRERAATHGLTPGDQELEQAVRFVQEYVEHVPAYLRDGMEAARVVGREPEMREVLDAATSYWLTPADIIPDRLGLLGIMDDAYYALSLMQAVSDRYEDDTGRPLFARNLQAANASIRNLIGEPAASQIDMFIGTRLNADPMTQMLRALTAMSSHRGAFPIPERESIWGDRSTEDMVKARLGGFGLA